MRRFGLERRQDRVLIGSNRVGEHVGDDRIRHEVEIEIETVVRQSDDSARATGRGDALLSS
jgi:hypothetical protein